MPQQSLLTNEYPTMIGARVAVTSMILEHLHDVVRIDVEVRHQGKPWNTVMSFELEGTECDYINTIGEEVLGSWMFGEKWQDVVRNVEAVRKLAKMHGRLHPVPEP